MYDRVVLSRRSSIHVYLNSKVDFIYHPQLTNPPSHTHPSLTTPQASFTSNNQGEEVFSSHRTSTFAFVRKFADPTITRIEARASDLVALSIENVEPLQIVSYRDGQHFGDHHDAGEVSDGV